MSQTCEDVMVVFVVQALDHIPQMDVPGAAPEVQSHADENPLARGERTGLHEKLLGDAAQARVLPFKQETQELGMILENEIQDFLHPALMPACSLPIQHNGLS